MINKQQSTETKKTVSIRIYPSKKKFLKNHGVSIQSIVDFAIDKEIQSIVKKAEAMTKKSMQEYTGNAKAKKELNSSNIAKDAGVIQLTVENGEHILKYAGKIIATRTECIILVAPNIDKLGAKAYLYLCEFVGFFGVTHLENAISTGKVFLAGKDSKGLWF